MKKFKFKLWPLLKIKEIEKLKIEQRLSIVLNEITKRVSEIDFNLKDIRTIIESSSSERSMNLLFGQDYLNHRKNNIRVLRLEIEKFENDKSAILKELVRINREIDKLVEIKEEDFVGYKKQISKKEEQGIEEVLMLRNTSLGESDYE
jgi:flagellar FliJ protein